MQWNRHIVCVRREICCTIQVSCHTTPRSVDLVPTMGVLRPYNAHVIEKNTSQKITEVYRHHRLGLIRSFRAQVFHLQDRRAYNLGLCKICHTGSLIINKYPGAHKACVLRSEQFDTVSSCTSNSRPKRDEGRGIRLVPKRR